MIGRWISALVFVAGLSREALAQPQPALHRSLPEVVLSDAVERLSIGDFGLGGGGVDGGRGGLRFHATDGCITPGGVHVACRDAGVKLTFPSGRTLLVAADGGVHLRSGEAAGPFRAGVELMLADDSRVQVMLAQSRKHRVRDVQVVSGERALQPWRRGAAANAVSRARPWAGVRIACCGDGGDLYRPVAIGPMVVVERVLVTAGRREVTPRQRLVVLTRPLREALRRMPRQHRETQRDVRRAVAAVIEVVDRSAAIFRAGAALHRAQRDRLRWLLAEGFELALDLDGPLAPRLQLFAGRSPLPMVEWTLGAAGAAYLTNPIRDQLGKRWHGNGTRMPKAVTELQVREHLDERQLALRTLRRLAGKGG